MGKLSCSVMIGFVALHVAVIMCIIAFATPEWAVGNLHVNDTNSSYPDTKNTSRPEQSKGLWEFCIEAKNCTKLNSTAQPKWFKAVQGLDTAGVGLGIFAIILAYALLLVESCKNSARVSVFNLAIQMMAGAVFLTTLIIFGMRMKHDDTSNDFSVDDDIKYGWSYYVNIAGTVLMLVSALMTLRSAVYFTNRQSGYENI